MLSLPPESPLEDCPREWNFSPASGRAVSPDKNKSENRIEASIPGDDNTNFNGGNPHGQHHPVCQAEFRDIKRG